MAIAAKGIAGFLAMMSPSPALAADIFGWANVGLIASLAVGVVSTVLLVWMGNIKEADLRMRLAEAASGAASANEGVSIANVELAKQKTLTAQAKRETERIKAQVSWRSVSAAQAKTIRKRLTGDPYTLAIVFPPDDAEAEAFAFDIANALHGSTVTPEIGYPYAFHGFDTGLETYAYSGRQERAKALSIAFAAAGINLGVGKPLNPAAPPAHPDGQLVLVVGHKPRPTLK